MKRCPPAAAAAPRLLEPGRQTRSSSCCSSFCCCKGANTITALFTSTRHRGFAFSSEVPSPAGHRKRAVILQLLMSMSVITLCLFLYTHTIDTSMYTNDAIYTTIFARIQHLIYTDIHREVEKICSSQQKTVKHNMLMIHIACT